MKTWLLTLCTLSLIHFSCNKKAFITQQELNGTWERTFSLSKNDKIEISQDTLCVWHNYRNTRQSRHFTIKYSSDKSRVTLYRNGCRQEQFDILRDKKGRLLFHVYDVNAIGSDNEMANQTITYRKKN